MQPTVDTVTEQKKRYHTWIEVDLNAILANLTTVRQYLTPATHLLAVIKANAYGHGLLPVARLLAEQVHYFGVNSADEALILRQAGIATPILVFGPVPPACIADCLQHHVSLTVSSLAVAERISRAAAQQRGRAKVHIKVDTGMGRLGLLLKTAGDTIHKIAALPGLELEALYTHCPNAEYPDDEFTLFQLNNFQGLIATCAVNGVTFRYQHVANSAAIVNFPSSHLNLVRPGVFLYGLYAEEALRQQVPLRSVLALRSRIIFLKVVDAGASVSYRREYRAPRKTTIATIPVGYGHGYPFQLKGVGEVLIQGRRHPIVGRITMDYLMIDVGFPCAYHVGDEVTLLGASGTDEITASELAIRAHTIAYDIVTKLSPTIPRLYHHAISRS